MLIHLRFVLLNPGSDLNIQKIVYYNRGDASTVQRAIGLTLELQDDAGKTVWKSAPFASKDLIQTYTFTQTAKPVPVPGQRK